MIGCLERCTLREGQTVCQGKRSNRVTAGSRKQAACMVMILSGWEGGGSAGSWKGSDTRRAAGGLMRDLTANQVENMGFGPSGAAPSVQSFGQIQLSLCPSEWCKEMVATSSFRCVLKVKAVLTLNVASARWQQYSHLLCTCYHVTRAPSGSQGWSQSPLSYAPNFKRRRKSTQSVRAVTRSCCIQ